MPPSLSGVLEVLNHLLHVLCFADRSHKSILLGRLTKVGALLSKRGERVRLCHQILRPVVTLEEATEDGSCRASSSMALPAVHDNFLILERAVRVEL